MDPSVAGSGGDVNQNQNPEQAGPSPSLGSGGDGDDPIANQTEDTVIPPAEPPSPTAEPDLSYNGNMREYCKSLENWLWRAYWQRECAVSAFYTALSTFYPLTYPPQSYPQMSQQPGQYSGNQNVPPPHSAGQAFNNNIGDVQNNNQNVRQVLFRGIRRQGNRVIFDFKRAPIWKRLMAECIDFFILLVVKIFVTLSIVDNFDLIDLDNLDLDAIQESGSLMDVALSLTSELILLELTHRVVVCFFEAYCLFKGGATPGKSILGLRVLYCQEVYPVMSGQLNNVDGSRILISPGSFLTFPRALVRSLIKNFSLALFFPICFTIFHFEHSRTVYDVASKSIVVEIRL